MLSNDLSVIDGVSAGAWIKRRLEGEIGTVTSQHFYLDTAAPR